MIVYIHERPYWPGFHWDRSGLADELAAVRHRQGRLFGRMEALDFRLREEAVLNTLTQVVLKSSEIEGEILDVDRVRSSRARRLGIDIGALAPPDRDVEGIVEMMLDATQKYQEPLTEERLFGWSAALFPTRAQRHAENRGRHLAERGVRPHASRLGANRQRAYPLPGHHTTA
jgi:Fic family protein